MFLVMCCNVHSDDFIAKCFNLNLLLESSNQLGLCPGGLYSPVLLLGICT